MTSSALNPNHQPYSLRTALVGIAEHLDTHGLPEPATVSLSWLRGCIECQPQYREPQAMADELVAWADSMHSTVIELHRLRVGQVHLEVTGHLDDGHQVTFYTEAPDSLTADHLDALALSERAVLTVSALRAWAVAESGVIA